MYTEISELAIDLRNKSQSHQLQILLHGADLESGGGRAVALHFQNFLIKTQEIYKLVVVFGNKNPARCVTSLVGCGAGILHSA